VGKYTNLPTLYVDFIKPEEMSFSSEGDGVDGGRNGDGDSPAIDFSGGGKLIGSYENCWVQAREEHEYANWLAAYLSGSRRCINVPILTDWPGPFPFLNRTTPQPIVKGIPHDDGSLFSDGAGYSQATVFGTIETAAALGAGQVVLNVFGATRPLRWSDWFSIYHPTRGWRAYRYWECTDPIDVTRTVDGFSYIGQQFTIALDRPLREAVSAGDRIEFARPLCVMRFPRGFNLEWRVRGFWQSRPSLKFVEAEVR
jgi:hypothetical protein